MEKFTYEYHHCGANKKIGDIINNKDKSPETLGLIDKGQEITKPGKETFGSILTTRTEKCGSPGDQTREEKMRWQQLT